MPRPPPGGTAGPIDSAARRATIPPMVKQLLVIAAVLFLLMLVVRFARGLLLGRRLGGLETTNGATNTRIEPAENGEARGRVDDKIT